jgi:hypothetical protein
MFSAKLKALKSPAANIKGGDEKLLPAGILKIVLLIHDSH